MRRKVLRHCVVGGVFVWLTLGIMSAEGVEPLRTTSDAQATYEQALLAYAGKDVPLDLDAAEAGFVRAHELAKQGQALEEDCSRWYYGMGVEPNARRAFECAGRRKDLLTLAVLYANGEGVPNDAAKAEALIRQVLARHALSDPETELHGKAHSGGGPFQIILACADDRSTAGMARCQGFESTIAEGNTKRQVQATTASLEPTARAVFTAYVVAELVFYEANYAYLVATYQGAPMGQMVSYGWEDFGRDLQTLSGYTPSLKLTPVDLTKAESALSAAIQDAAAYWDDPRNGHTAEGRVAVKSALTAAQHAWEQYRDARVALNTALVGPKQGASQVELDTRVTLTQARSNEITRSLAE
jgi:TPR repeat protein